MSSYLKVIPYSEFYIWDAKHYFSKAVNSSLKIDRLGNHIREESHRVKLNEEPDAVFGILGISNVKGMFDAYEEYGKNINQSYKKVENNYIAYNPYRVNVGSIGIKTDELKYTFISPAYVVFSCKETMLPEYLFLLMKSKRFNAVIRDNTSGSVRQNLSFKTLSNLQIPIPSIEQQKQLIKDYYNALEKCNNLLKKSADIYNQINDLFRKELFIEEIQNPESKMFATVKASSLSKRWDAWDKHMKYKSTVFDYTDFGNYVISDPQYGAGEKGLDEFTGIRYIRITDINEDGTLNDEVISAAKSEDKYKLKDNDFLIARSGNTVGKTYLYKNNDGPAIYAGYLVRYELDYKKVIPEYMLFYTKSFLFKSWIESAQRISGQPNINGQEYLLASVIVPSIEIQKNIVEKATRLRDQALKIKNEYKTSLEKAKDDFANKVFEG